MKRTISGWDERVSRAIVALRRPTITRILQVFTVTAWGGCWAFYVVALFLAVRFGGFDGEKPFLETLLSATVAPGLAWIFVTATKWKWRRRRPFQLHPEFRALTWSGNGDSFPSGHAASVFAFFFALVCGDSAMAIPSSFLMTVLCWAVVIGFSRVYLAVHFLSDVIAGAVLGSVVGAAWGIWGVL